MTKRKTSVTLEEETLAWIEKKIGDKQFASVSHAVEYAINQLRKQEKQ
jgi:Arc/MetJ-type ribon-helix-helix transcriptional regulator